MCFPSQGGKYAGFGNSCGAPPANLLPSGFCDIGKDFRKLSVLLWTLQPGRQGCRGWLEVYFTPLAGQSFGMTEKMLLKKSRWKPHNKTLLVSDTSIAGKMTQAVGSRNSTLSNLWAQPRSEYSMRGFWFASVSIKNGMSGYQPRKALPRMDMEATMEESDDLRLRRG